MKRFVGAVSIFLCGTMCAGTVWAAKDFKNDAQRESYAIGANMAKQLKLREAPFDVEFIYKGLKDQKAGKSKLSGVEIDLVLQKMRDDAQKKAKGKVEKLTAENKKKGERFLAENAKKEGVNTLPGGVQYKVLAEGTGIRPSGDDVVLVYYRGTLLNGTEFDRSGDKPKSLKMRKMIDGLKDALMQMPVGSTWQLFIPASKGYGEQGFGTEIGPSETLIFEIELVEILT